MENIQSKKAPGMKQAIKEKNVQDMQTNLKYEEQNTLVKQLRQQVVHRLNTECKNVELQAVNQQNKNSVLEMYSVTMKDTLSQCQAWAIYYYDEKTQPQVKITIHIPLFN
jgi:hypothetical protein